MIDLIAHFIVVTLASTDMFHLRGIKFTIWKKKWKVSYLYKMRYKWTINLTLYTSALSRNVNNWSKYVLLYIFNTLTTANLYVIVILTAFTILYLSKLSFFFIYVMVDGPIKCVYVQISVIFLSCNIYLALNPKT